MASEVANLIDNPSRGCHRDNFVVNTVAIFLGSNQKKKHLNLKIWACPYTDGTRVEFDKPAGPAMQRTVNKARKSISRYREITCKIE